mmetsp:Transcript_40107/g.93140  ORF Transcript_40107/g.93140 Transcript_40107/m.93140 type:complete len:242 (-) Transcript_40107:309-1034(-)
MHLVPRGLQYVRQRGLLPKACRICDEMLLGNAVAGWWLQSSSWHQRDPWSWSRSCQSCVAKVRADLSTVTPRPERRRRYQTHVQLRGSHYKHNCRTRTLVCGGVHGADLLWGLHDGLGRLVVWRTATMGGHGPPGPECRALCARDCGQQVVWADALVASRCCHRGRAWNTGNQLLAWIAAVVGCALRGREPVALSRLRWHPSAVRWALGSDCQQRGWHGARLARLDCTAVTSPPPQCSSQV